MDYLARTMIKKQDNYMRIVKIELKRLNDSYKIDKNGI
jgi:hypothetical protein